MVVWGGTVRGLMMGQCGVSGDYEWGYVGVSSGGGMSGGQCGLGVWQCGVVCGLAGVVQRSWLGQYGMFRMVLEWCQSITILAPQSPAYISSYADTTTKDTCNLPKESGHCDSQIYSYYYDIKTDRFLPVISDIMWHKQHQRH